MNRIINFENNDPHKKVSDEFAQTIESRNLRSTSSSKSTLSSAFLHNPQKTTPFGELATPQSRLIALLIDALIFGLGFGIIWIIWFVTLAEKGTTPGHHLMGQVVIDAETGRALGWKRMVVREILIKGLLHWILGSFLFMTNYILDGAFILTSSQRTLHDLVVGSQVIQKTDKTIVSKLKVEEVDTWLNKQ